MPEDGFGNGFSGLYHSLIMLIHLSVFQGVYMEFIPPSAVREVTTPFKAALGVNIWCCGETSVFQDVEP